MDTGRDGRVASDAELLEQYAIRGEEALRDPRIAAYLAAHPTLRQEVDAGLAVLRRAITPDPVATAAPAAASPRAQRREVMDGVVAPDKHFGSRFIDSWGARSSRSETQSLRRNTWSWSRTMRYVLVSICAAIVSGIAILSRRADVGTTPHTRTYATHAGERALVSLENGTQALLGPVTTLTVATNSHRGGTYITVDGQALFTVLHHDRSALVVRAGHAMVRVLGTTFVVRRYATDSVTQIVVQEGRVSIRGIADANVPANGAVLSANTIGIVDDSGRVDAIPNIAVENYTAWTRGELVFQQTPVRDIVSELNRVYAAHIQVADSLLNRRALTLTVSVAQLSLGDVVEAVAVALDAHVVRRNNQLMIVPGLLPSRRSTSPHNSISTLERQYGR